jgi:radical SAM superfamily enzyme YgiQ (UPF0313 family)
MDSHQRSLKTPGAVLLVSCYELGHQPIGLAQSLGFLEQAGYAAATLDIAVEEFDEQRVKNARAVGISVPMHTALRLGVQVAQRVRELNPDSHICFFGLYAPINAHYLLDHVADSVIGGEYERPLVDLIEALEAGSGAKEQAIEGVSRHGQIVGPYLNKLWSTLAMASDRPVEPLPIPNRKALPALDRYAVLQRDGRQELVGYVEASRGCLHLCRHCPIVPVYNGRFFVVPASVVLEDIRQQVKAGARHMTFGDPDFLNGPGHSLSILRTMHAEFPDLTFDFTAKIEHILKHRALFPELAELGCLFVISALESFSDTVLAHLAKGHTQADIVSALDILCDAGITLRPSLVAFTPWTTLADYLEMFDIIAHHDPRHHLIDAIDPVQYSIRLLLPPGSALLTESDGQPAAIREFLGSLDQAAFQYQWSHPDPRMDELQRCVREMVEEAARHEEDAAITFEHLWQLAAETAGRPRPVWKARHRRVNGPKPPRLTEPWFCCAEPTTRQLSVLKSES